MTSFSTEDPATPEPTGEVPWQERLMNRRVLLAGAAGVGVLGVGGAVAALRDPGGSTTVAASPSASATATPTRTAVRRTATPSRSTAAATGTPTATAPPTTTSAATSAPPTSAPPSETSAPTSAPPAPPSSAPPSSAPPSSAPPTTKPPTSPPEPPGEFLANTSDVPLNGGLVLETDDGTVVTHPAGPTFCAFTSICTHEGCPVDSVRKNTISCPCHGSQFDAATGAVVNGPAKRPLATKAVVVQDGAIYLA